MASNNNLVRPQRRPCPFNNLAKTSGPSVNLNLEDSYDINIGDQSITISMENLEFIENIGNGNFGIVQKMKHKESEHLLAVKIIRFITKCPNQNRLLNDLTISKRCRDCPYIVCSYCALNREGDIWICMELMDTSLDKFYCKIPEGDSMPETLLAYVSFSMVTALNFLYRNLNVIHRDVKPGNVLLDRGGRVQLCDFGISGFLVRSKVISDVGTRRYVAPERISDGNKEYTVLSDVWSLGVTVIEVAACKFPYPTFRVTFDLLQLILNSVAPHLGEEAPYSHAARDFIGRCLVKEPTCRAKYEDLLKHDFVKEMSHGGNEVTERKTLMGDYVCQVLNDGR